MIYLDYCAANKEHHVRYIRWQLPWIHWLPFCTAGGGDGGGEEVMHSPSLLMSMVYTYSFKCYYYFPLLHVK